MGPIYISGNVGRVLDAVDDLTAAFTAKSAMIVDLEFKLATKSAVLTYHVEAFRGEADSHLFGLEEKVISLKVDYASARAYLARHVA